MRESSGRHEGNRQPHARRRRSAVYVCAICGATVARERARRAGWSAYELPDQGDDPLSQAQASGLSLRCGRCVLGLVLVTLQTPIDDDPDLVAIRDGYLQALARRRSESEAPAAGS
jgi:hypothetical protein